MEIHKLIREIVEYKWHGEGDYQELKEKIDDIKDDKTREKLEKYLEEAKEFLDKNAIEKDVEKELLEEWLLNAKPVKAKVVGNKIVFDLSDNKDKEKGKDIENE